MTHQKIKVPPSPDLYQLQPSDYERGCQVLGDAFRKDPMWGEILTDFPDEYPNAFGMPLTYSIYYGKAFSSSLDLEGIACWIADPFTNISLWRLIQSGAIKPSLKLRAKVIKRILQVFSIIVKDRKRLMKNSYLYLFTLGVRPDKQGQGIGTKLVKNMVNAIPHKIPVYLETGTMRNVRFYEKLGFQVVNEVQVPLLDLPMWEMVYSKK